jgi:hypothetical protein
MKSKNTKTELSKLKRKISILKKDIDCVYKEHNSLVFRGSKQDAAKAFDLLPVMTLHDSLQIEKQKVANQPKFLSRIKRKSELSKKFVRMNEELECLLHKKQEMELDLLLLKVKSIVND